MATNTKAVSKIERKKQLDNFKESGSTT